MPAKRVYLDSSSIVKRYVEENGSEITDEVYESAEAGSLKVFFSAWNVGEVIGTLDRYLSRKLLAKDEFETSLFGFITESIKLGRLGSLSVIPLRADDLIASWLLVLQQHLYEADALQISVAKGSSCDLLLASDRHLVDASKREGLAALNVETEQEDIRKTLSS